MKTRFLFPYYFKFIGIVLFLVHVPVMHHQLPLTFGNADGLFNQQHLFLLFTTVLMTVGLLMIAFSKERIEDEQIAQLRLDSLQWALYLNYFLLIVILVFTDKEVNHILLVNVWGPLVFFIIRFRWMMYRLGRSVSGEGN